MKLGCKIRMIPDYPDIGTMTEEEARAKILQLTGRKATVAYKAFRRDSLGRLRNYDKTIPEGIYTPGKLHTGDDEPCVMKKGYHAYPDMHILGKNIWPPPEGVVYYYVLLAIPDVSVVLQVQASKYLYIPVDGMVDYHAPYDSWYWGKEVAPIRD